MTDPKETPESPSTATSQDPSTAASQERTSTLRAELGYIDDTQLAEFFHITIDSVRSRRSRGHMPPSAKIGNVNLTRIQDLWNWVETQRVRQPQRKRRRRANLRLARLATKDAA
jgi:hypothetical protein